MTTQNLTWHNIAQTVVERTLAWISHSRRLTRDFERYARSAGAFIRLAMIRIMLGRLTNQPFAPES